VTYPLGPGDTGSRIAMAKVKLGIPPYTEEWTEDLTYRIRGFQALRGMEVTGLLEPEVLEALESM
jgi:hypothetical protein